MKRIHETVSGHRIEFDVPSDAVAAYLARLRAAAEDARTSYDELTSLLYSHENPVLDTTQTPGRGLVTAAVLEDPVYRVMTDLLDRKLLAQRGETPEQMGAPYTMTVAEAARELGIDESAVRRAIHGRRLPSWVRDGRHFVNPKDLALLAGAGRRGPLPAGVRPLQVRTGYAAGRKLEVKSTEETTQATTLAFRSARKRGEPFTQEQEITRWRRIAVLTGARDSLRFFVLEPDVEGSGEPTVLEHGDFFVRGFFRIVAKENNAARAARAWEDFRAA